MNSWNNFSRNKTLPIHRWVPWIAGFSSDFVKCALNGFLKKKGTVLDPFCGVGTTIVEAILGGHNAVGFEINPYAVLASRAKANVQIINDSFFHCRKHLLPASVDLIITSPPYLNNYHYNRNTRPQLYWLGYAHSPQDLRKLEDMNFGKFWQTVRDLDRLDLSFSLPDADIAERLRVLRKLNKEKGHYGGNGWANYAASYFNDCLKFAQGINYVLKPKGAALVVIGNSILQGVMIPTDEYFGKIAESAGLELVKIDIPRATRVGNSIIQSDVRVCKAKAAHQLYEAVVVLRKP